MPALVYSSIMVNEGEDKNVKKSNERKEKKKNVTKSNESKLDKLDPDTESVTEESNSVKLGLGDFVFYSILVGKSSQLLNYFIILSIILSMFIGLILTLIILVLIKKPMPALPFSIFIGLIVYILAYNFVIIFQKELNFRSIYV